MRPAIEDVDVSGCGKISTEVRPMWRVGWMADEYAARIDFALLHECR